MGSAEKAFFTQKRIVITRYKHTPELKYFCLVLISLGVAACSFRGRPCPDVAQHVAGPMNPHRTGIPRPDAYTSGRALRNRDCDGLIARADKALRDEQYVEADSLYRLALDCAPKAPEVWNNFGTANYKAGRLETADCAFVEAIELDPDYLPAWLNLCVMARDNGDLPQAVEYLQKADTLPPVDDKTSGLLYTLKSELGMITEYDP